MKSFNFCLIIIGITLSASTAYAVIGIDAKAYHAQHEAEKRARQEASYKNQMTPQPVETKAKENPVEMNKKWGKKTVAPTPPVTVKPQEVTANPVTMPEIFTDPAPAKVQEQQPEFVINADAGIISSSVEEIK